MSRLEWGRVLCFQRVRGVSNNSVLRLEIGDWRFDVGDWTRNGALSQVVLALASVPNIFNRTLSSLARKSASLWEPAPRAATADTPALYSVRVMVCRWYFGSSTKLGKKVKGRAEKPQPSQGVDLPPTGRSQFAVYLPRFRRRIKTSAIIRSAPVSARAPLR